jgi:hypothetical protein
MKNVRNSLPPIAPYSPFGPEQFVRYSALVKKFRQKMCFLEKRFQWLTRPNEVKFSCEIVLPPNTPNSPFGPENR